MEAPTLWVKLVKFLLWSVQKSSKERLWSLVWEQTRSILQLCSLAFVGNLGGHERDGAWQHLQFPVHELPRSTMWRSLDCRRVPRVLPNEWQQSVNPPVRMGGLRLAVVCDPGTVVKPRKIGGQETGVETKGVRSHVFKLTELELKARKCTGEVFLRVFKAFLLIRKLVPTS